MYIWNEFENKFNCKVALNEPSEGFVLLDKNSDKLFNLGTFSENEIALKMKQSIADGINILMSENLGNEIKRNYNTLSDRVL